MCQESIVKESVAKMVENKSGLMALSHLSMRQEIPIAIPTHHPQVEDEFIPSKSS